MALSASSSLTDIQNQIDDNAGYDESRSVVMGRAYRTAVRMMKMRLAKESEVGDQGSSLKTNLEMMEAELKTVTDWLLRYDTEANSDLSGPRVILAGMECFRD